MFERFTESARAAAIGARDEALALGHDAIGCEHLLLALAAGPQDDPAAGALRRAGVGVEPLRAEVRAATAGRGLDAAALAAIGIDLDEVRRRVEDAFGPGALDRRRACGDPPFAAEARRAPFSPEAKKALELALRYAVHRGDRHIGSEHVLLGVLRASPDESGAVRALRRLGVEPDRLRALLEGARSA